MLIKIIDQDGAKAYPHPYAKEMVLFEFGKVYDVDPFIGKSFVRQGKALEVVDTVDNSASATDASAAGVASTATAPAQAIEPVATEPVATEPVATEPVATEPVATEPVATEPVATEPVATEPVAKDSGNNAGNEPVATVTGEKPKVTNSASKSNK